MFALVILTFFTLAHYLFYARVIKKLHFEPVWQKSLMWLVIFNALGVASYVMSRYFLELPLPLYYLASLSIGVGFVFFVFWLIYEFLHLLQKNVSVDPHRRKFFKKTTDIGFVSLGTMYLGTAVYEGSKQPAVKFVNVDQNRFETPVRVVQISDMHIGGLIDETFVKQSVKVINKLNPDIVVFTGDIVDVHISEVSKAVDWLTKIRCDHGPYFVTGNHEFFHGIEDTMAYLNKIGVDVLQNENRTVHVRGQKVQIIGVHDVHGFREERFKPDLAKATARIDTDSPALLLAHQPRFAYYLNGFAPDLMLSGHTHGGQIWPFNFLVRLAQPYEKGLHRLKNGGYIYVNSGIGFWGPPMRLGTQAEVTCIDWK